jgi:hypothetical protein
LLAAQSKKADSTKADTTKLAAALTNLSIPDIPAFTFLGATPTNIARPNGARAFGAALLQGVDANGKAKQGFALEVLPVLQLAKISLTAYQGSLGARLLSNLQLSLGTAKASGDTASTDVGMGLRTTVFDTGDPLANKAFVAMVDSLTNKCTPEFDDTKVRETVIHCLGEVVKKAGDEWNKRHWNSSAWVVAAALGTQLVQSQISTRRSLGWKAWTTASQGIADWGMVLAHTAYEDNRSGGPDSSFKALSYGARILVGGSSLNGFAEVVRQRRWDAKGAIEESPTVWSAGFEFPAAKDLWISAGMGKPYEKVKAPDRVFVFANIKWGVSGKSRLDPR